ncbi:hypothetical protein [Micromonospora sp.]|uniref:hypothetical protein n=1 Tax=Micromonospora sp. TaxID=1876 RepID=UPI003B3B5B24
MNELPPLTVLLCDNDQAAAGRLYRELAASPMVDRVLVAEDLDDAAQRMAGGGYEVVVVDPLNLGLGATSDFVARIRGRDPLVAFVLHVDVAETERPASVFYQGDRARFRELFVLDKRVPDEMLPAETRTVLTRCQAHRLLAEGQRNATRLLDEVYGIAEANQDPSLRQLAESVDTARILDRVPVEPALVQPAPVPNTVFLSYRFVEEQGYVEGLRGLLEDNGFQVVTGRAAEGYVGKAVLNRIRECEAFLSVMTRHQRLAEPADNYTTSAWLIEEKGAALAFNKYIVLLVETGVGDIGGLQGDWQRHEFTPQTFLTAARAAIRQLRARFDTRG